jgi:CDP-glucose 4,6-dehydratase
MEGLVMFGDSFRGKTVWLSGHTGFKGAWLAQWLHLLGARVHGFALPPATTPSLFTLLGLIETVEHEVGDLCDKDAVRRSIARIRPDFVFHLGAQALVRASYEHPIATWATNVMGTAHVLDALRPIQKPCAVVIVTSDKCYENREWTHGYREEDPLGGHDPYSASKGAAEILTAAFRRSFFEGQPVRIASARAGNVIGGGDWAADRIVPDCIRALTARRPIPVRNKVATRPWQHVLEPLSGYLWLAARLSQPALSATETRNLCGAFNFGPGHGSNQNVESLVTEVLKHWPGKWQDRSDPKAPHEARLLQLATDKAHAYLGWSPVWDFQETVEHTVSWYRQAARRGNNVVRITQRQIKEYAGQARRLGISWALG